MAKTRRKQRSRVGRRSKRSRRSRVARRSKVGRRSRVGRRSKSIGNNRRFERKRRGIRRVQVGGPSVFSPSAAGVAEMDRRLDEKLLRERQVGPERVKREEARRQRGKERRVAEREAQRDLERRKQDFADQQAAAKTKRKEGEQQQQKQDPPQTTIQWEVVRADLKIWEPSSEMPSSHHLKNPKRKIKDDGNEIEVGDILLGSVTRWSGEGMTGFWDFEAQERVRWLEYKKIKKPNVKKPLNEHGWVQVGRKFMGAANIVPIKGEPAPEYRVPPS